MLRLTLTIALLQSVCSVLRWSHVGWKCHVGIMEAEPGLGARPVGRIQVPAMQGDRWPASHKNMSGCSKMPKLLHSLYHSFTDGAGQSPEALFSFLG